MLKKITAIMAAAVMTLSLAACGSSDDSESSGVYITKKKNTGKTTTAAEAAIPEAEDSDGSEAADSEAEPEPEMTLEEYLQSGVWSFTDESFAELDKIPKTRWQNTFFDSSVEQIYCPLSLVSGNYGEYVRFSDELDSIYDPKKPYTFTFATNIETFEGTIEGDKMEIIKTYDKFTVKIEDVPEGSRREWLKCYGPDVERYTFDYQNPITLVRKERIPMEQQLKDVVGTFKLVQDDSIFGSLDEEDQKAYDYIRGSGTITIREDGTCLNQKGEETTVTFFDPDDQNFDLANLGELKINYLYRENEDILYATYYSANNFYYRLERVN